MRNFACSLITALLCVLFLMVGGCAEGPTSPEPDHLSDAQPSLMNTIEGAEGVEDQEGIPVVREEEAPVHEDPPRDDTVPDMPEITVTELGKSFTISLVSNPTTGYSWRARFDPEYLELVNNDFVNNSNLIGAPGVESFELKAIKQGQTELWMIYKRSWEDQFAEKRVMLVQITGAPEIMETHVGENFTVLLKSNPSTGYTWQVGFDSEYLELVNKEFVIDSELVPPPPGCGGVETFEFTALKKGQTEVKMVYKRPWEDQSADECITLVKIGVREYW